MPDPAPPSDLLDPARDHTRGGRGQAEQAPRAVHGDTLEPADGGPPLRNGEPVGVVVQADTRGGRGED